MKKILPPIMAAFVFSAAASSAATLIQDGFSGTGTLDTHTPDTTGTTAWAGNAGFALSSGAVTYANGATPFAAGMASIDMGAGYFASHPGTYQLSVTITYASATANTGVWGIGFSTATSSLGAITLASGGDGSQIGRPWAFIRENGQATVRDNATSGGTTITTTGLTHNLVITLNTSAAVWTYSVTADGTPVVGTTAVNGSTPALRYVAITSTTPNGSIDNFKLDFTAVPEPSALALAAFGAFALSALRKRRA